MFKKLISILAFILPSSISRMLFRLTGHRIGRNTKMTIFSYIYADEIEIGNDVDIRPLVFISVCDLKIGNNAIISYGVNVKGPRGFFTKDNSFIGPHCLINCDEDVRIGFYSGLGPKCTVYTHGSFLPVIEGYPIKFEKVILEDRVWTGMEVMLLPGAYIESNCIINPGVIIGNVGQILSKLSENSKFVKIAEDYQDRDIKSARDVAETFPVFEDTYSEVYKKAEKDTPQLQ